MWGAARLADSAGTPAPDEEAGRQNVTEVAESGPGLGGEARGRKTAPLQPPSLLALNAADPGHPSTTVTPVDEPTDISAEEREFRSW